MTATSWLGGSIFSSFWTKSFISSISSNVVEDWLISKRTNLMLERVSPPERARCALLVI